jgi:hypothetical protein
MNCIELDNCLDQLFEERDKYINQTSKDIHCTELAIKLKMPDAMYELGKIIDFIIGYYNTLFGNPYPNVNDDETIQWFLNVIYSYQRTKLFMPHSLTKEEYIRYLQNFSYMKIIPELKLGNYKYHYEISYLLDALMTNISNKNNVCTINQMQPSITLYRLKYGFIKLDNEAYLTYKKNQSIFPYDVNDYYKDDNLTLNGINNLN